MGEQAVTQLIGVAAVCAWSAIASLILAILIDKTIGLRAPVEAIEDGLDMAAHGERAYNP
jgi:Amt family ammonium transporter